MIRCHGPSLVLSYSTFSTRFKHFPDACCSQSLENGKCVQILLNNSREELWQNIKLNGLRVAILATDGFEQVELIEPRKALDAAGAKTTLIAPKSGKIQGMKHDEKGDKVDVDMTLDKAKTADFDAMLLPGGALNAGAPRVGKRSSGVRQENGRDGQTDCRHLSRAVVAGNRRAW
jgi:hypothetical protein